MKNKKIRRKEAYKRGIKRQKTPLKKPDQYDRLFPTTTDDHLLNFCNHIQKFHLRHAYHSGCQYVIKRWDVLLGDIKDRFFEQDLRSLKAIDEATMSYYDLTDTFLNIFRLFIFDHDHEGCLKIIEETMDFFDFSDDADTYRRYMIAKSGCLNFMSLYTEADRILMSFLERDEYLDVEAQRIENYLDRNDYSSALKVADKIDPGNLKPDQDNILLLKNMSMVYRMNKLDHKAAQVDKLVNDFYQNNPK